MVMQTWLMRATLSAGLVALTVLVTSAQTAEFVARARRLGPIVTGMPYQVEALTTVTQTLRDGTQISRRMAAKAFRDSAGRVRQEQIVTGLAVLDPAADERTIVTIHDVVAGVTYALDADARTARRSSIDPRTFTDAPPPPPPAPPAAPGDSARLAGPPPPPPAPPRPRVEALGTRMFQGVGIVGDLSRVTIPAGRIGNDRPIEIVDERWTSPELALLVHARYSDPRTGDVDYRVVRLDRREPSADLFRVPAGFRMVDAPPPPPPPPPPAPRANSSR
jgi:hypothetical protein